MKDGMTIVDLAALSVGLKDATRQARQAARAFRALAGGGTPRHPGRWGWRARAKRSRRLERAAERRAGYSLRIARNQGLFARRCREIHKDTRRDMVTAARAGLADALAPLLPERVTIGWADGQQG